MPFREKAMLLFKPKSRSDRDSTLSKSSTKDSSSTDRDRWPSNVYKPGEPMPRPKYRAIPKKEHKDKLEAFSFAEAWRRKSFQSQYSPMGTRAPSRRNSSRDPAASSSRRNSIFSLAGRRSTSNASEAGRTGSMTSAETEKSVQPAGGPKILGVAKPTPLDTEPEQEGDDDVANVGISRVQSAFQGPNTQGRSNKVVPAMSTAHDHQPFTEQELNSALQRSHLAVPSR